MKKKPFNRDEYRGDVMDMFRKLVGTVRIEDNKDFEGLKGQEKIDFLKFCHTVYFDKHFHMITRSIVFSLVLKAAMESQNMDETLVNRASANGVQLLEDFFGRYAKRYDAEFGDKDDDFDPTRSFDPVKQES